MSRYVKFMRGTADAFLKLTQKDNDTLYFIYENESAGNGVLYLGNKLIAGGGSSDLSSTSIDALSDVWISEGLQNASFLVYDENEGVWTNKTIDEALAQFVGATGESAGKAGLVPAPELGQTNLYLRSDGTWAPVEATGESSARIINVFNEQGASHDYILSQTEGQKGDLLIIHDPVGGTIPLHTPYVYGDEDWIPMSSSVTLAENVIAADGKHLDVILNELISKPDFDVDNVSISVDNNILSLKDYGVKYYHFNPETNDYELQQVDEAHPWPVGLEPRTVKANGDVILGWYEPNTTTVEGLETEITALQNEVEALQGEVDAKANSADVYTKLEVEQKIAAAAHLKRVEVDKLEDIDVDAPDADQYIYMVPSGLQDDDNKYYEYIVIEVSVYDEGTDSVIKTKRVERVGSWEVDLGDYAKITDVNNALAGKVDKVEGSRLMTTGEGEKLASIIDLIKSTDEHFTVAQSGKLELNDLPIAKVENLADVLNNKINKREGYDLISSANVQKLESLAFIKSLNTQQFTLSENGELSIVQVSMQSIEGLEDILNDKASVDEVTEVATSVTALTDKLNKYTAATDAKLAELDECLTWQNLS